SVYVPEEDLQEGELKEEEENNVDEKLQGSSYSSTEEEEEVGTEKKGSLSYQNSPVSATSNQDVESESLLSDGSDQLADFKSISSRDGQDPEINAHIKPKNEVQGDVDKMKAAYADFLSDTYWSGLGLGFKSPNNDGKICDSRNGSTRSEFDWHQDALSKTLQQTLPPRPASKPNLFSSVQLYRQNSKMYGTVFTGASRFRCRQCSAAYDTLVELTVHMNETGHYQDDNHKKDKVSSFNCTKSRKRAFHDMDKEDAQKVLKCLFCGDSFDSLQDLSVHMIKTKHYQKVPLKEQVPIITSKMIPQTKKRIFEVARPCSPDSTTGSFTDSGSQKNSNCQISSSNRYGYQNGASYTWQFEACKSQILKCMECGSSHDTLQQLTTHMMVTGHFLKVTSSASKKGKQLALDPLAVEKMHSLTEVPASGVPSLTTASKTSDDQLAVISEAMKEGGQGKQGGLHEEEKIQEDKEYEKIPQNSSEPTLTYQYLREEDLEASKGGSDILKSLENTVTSAINKAQNGAPSWSAYPSIHAAYQLSGVVKPSLQLASQVLQVKPSFSNKLRPIAPKGKLTPVSVSPCSQTNSIQCNNSQEKKDTNSIAEEKGDNVKGTPQAEALSLRIKSSDNISKDESCSDSQKTESVCIKGAGKVKECYDKEHVKNKESSASAINNGCVNLHVITSHCSDVLSVNPLSALQSVLNNHLGKSTEPLVSWSNSSPGSSTVPVIHKVNPGMVEKPSSSPAPSRPVNLTSCYLFESNDQPIDLTKSKSSKTAVQAQSCTSLPQKHALSDIADMVKVLPKATTPKPSTSSRITPVKLETDVRRFEDVATDISPMHKRKGRQSNWNPQHLLILQAQFASSLFQTSEGKYLLSDLGPQERLQISKFTGLSMTTISHWLANVKYQLRKTGGTKFLKNMDKGYPVFYCNDCASQFRTPSTYISHLESHLGFQVKDMSKLSVDQQVKVEKELSTAAAERSRETAACEEDTDSKFKCKLCYRTFVSKHAVKLHLSKTHSKSPESHSHFVSELDEE
uniref:Teashirt zinc finger homeobox 2 n=1 Tax=Latimeria chalumnae TaxID=7897 RepID=H3AS76_LATCH